MTWFPNEQKRTLNRLIAIWIYLLLPMKYTTFSGKSMMKSQLTYQRVLGKSMNVFNIFHIHIFVCLFVFLVFFLNYFFVCFCRIACIDAMIDQVDKNKDYKLDQTEFTDLLKPELVPFSKGMTLPFNNVKFLFSNVYF